jgi:two-component system sensor histidine kinase CreC
VSSTTQILLAFLIVVAGAFYFLVDNLQKQVERQYLQAIEEPMVDTANIIAGMLEQRLNGDGLKIEELRRAFESVRERQLKAEIYSLMKTSVAMNFYITNADGLVVFDSDHGRAEGLDFSPYFDVRRTLNDEYGARSSRSDEEDDGSSVMFVGAPIMRGDEIAGVVSVSKPQASMFFFIRETKNQIRWLGLLTFIATSLAALLLSRWFSRPLRRLTDYVRAILRGERAPLPKLHGSEGKTLGDAFEEMRDALEGRKYAETYVQTLTHEMKSPLAAIRGAAELLHEDMPPQQREKFLGNIEGETGRLQNIIDRLLSLSAIESKKNLDKPTQIDLARLIDEVCVNHEAALEAKNLRIEKDYQFQPEVTGEAFLLEMAVTNLLQNAIDFAPNESTITVSLSEEKTGSSLHACIGIKDSGPGIPDYALDRVFDRFYSLQHPGTGKKSSGLGLCFVREAAELHGGEATIGNRPDVAGTIAALRLRL